VASVQAVDPRHGSKLLVSGRSSQLVILVILVIVMLVIRCRIEP
jgi:hypothetical protein